MKDLKKVKRDIPSVLIRDNGGMREEANLSDGYKVIYGKVTDTQTINTKNICQHIRSVKSNIYTLSRTYTSDKFL